MDPGDLTITGSSLPQEILTISVEEELLVRIEHDGSVTYGATYTPDRAAQAFWKALGQYAPDIDSVPVELTPEEAYDQAMNIIG